MKNYKATIKVTRLYEIGFESPDPKQAAVDAETIIAEEDLGGNSHINEQTEITEVVEDKLTEGLYNNFKQKWDRVR